jgi:hypothetical protein
LAGSAVRRRAEGFRRQRDGDGFGRTVDCHHRRGAAPTPVDRDAYVRAGLPWFDFYHADARDLAASETLAHVKSVDKKLGAEEDPFMPVDPDTVIALGGVSPGAVTDGKW